MGPQNSVPIIVARRLYHLLSIITLSFPEIQLLYKRQSVLLVTAVR